MLRAAIVFTTLGSGYSGAGAQQGPCDPAAFRDVVANAGASITSMHEKNNKPFQRLLQNLRNMNNWGEAEYVAKAMPFVRDETTNSLDAANHGLLAKVQSLEAANAGTESGRCAMLGELKGSMDQLVANTAAKWGHMLEKAERASAQPVQAGFAQ